MFIDIIKLKFKEKFPNVNLSQSRVTAIAEKLNGLIKEESEIDSQLTLLDTITPFSEIARLDDVERNAKNRKPDATPPETPPKKDDEVPAWAQSIIDQNKALTEKLASVETQSLADKRTSSFKNAIKDLPKDQQDLKLKYFNKMNFNDDNDFLEHLNDVSAEVTAYAQSQKDSASSSYKPAKTAGSTTAISKTDQEAIDKAFG